MSAWGSMMYFSLFLHFNGGVGIESDMADTLELLEAAISGGLSVLE